MKWLREFIDWIIYKPVETEKQRHERLAWNGIFARMHDVTPRRRLK